MNNRLPYGRSSDRIRVGVLHHPVEVYFSMTVSLYIRCKCSYDLYTGDVELSVLSLMGLASFHLVKKSVAVRQKRLPFFEALNGPIRSTPREGTEINTCQFVLIQVPGCPQVMTLWRWKRQYSTLRK